MGNIIAPPNGATGNIVTPLNGGGSNATDKVPVVTPFGAKTKEQDVCLTRVEA